ncbi:hypothetical protein [Luteimonas changyuni]|uniref:hypothetical protein n=1 Tax=Luteimonas sp. MJ145 TaxID=3129234 RepID=UPI0031BACBF9
MSAVDTILARLDGVQRSGKGHRAMCPACGGRSRKVAVHESDEGRALLHCFGGCDILTILQAVGLELADLFPERLRDDSPDGRRQARRAARESQWGAALDVLGLEAGVVLVAARQLGNGESLTPEDHDRLRVACHRIDDARGVLRDPPRYQPQQARA